MSFARIIVDSQDVNRTSEWYEWATKVIVNQSSIEWHEPLVFSPDGRIYWKYAPRVRSKRVHVEVEAANRPGASRAISVDVKAANVTLEWFARTDLNTSHVKLPVATLDWLDLWSWMHFNATPTQYERINHRANEPAP